MIKLGLTGGIGSGKSTVARVFQELGVPVYYADIEAKKFLSEEVVINSLIDLFGNGIIDKNGKIDKSILASIVFNDEIELSKLNELIHPLLKQDFIEWVAVQDYPYIVKEAAILFEAGFDKSVDKVLTISAPLDQRINRVIARDHVNKEQVMARVSKQWTDQEREAKSDFVIHNADNDMVLDKILSLHEKLLS